VSESAAPRLRAAELSCEVVRDGRDPAYTHVRFRVPSGHDLPPRYVSGYPALAAMREAARVVAGRYAAEAEWSPAGHDERAALEAFAARASAHAGIAVGTVFRGWMLALTVRARVSELSAAPWPSPDAGDERDLREALHRLRIEGEPVPGLRPYQAGDPRLWRWSLG
jgi:hypothetical protein